MTRTLQTAPVSVERALPDDEDGLNHPLADPTLTIGAQPSVGVVVTTGSATNPKRRCQL